MAKYSPVVSGIPVGAAPRRPFGAPLTTPAGDGSHVPLAGEDRVKLDNLQEWVAQDLRALEDEIDGLLQSDLPLLQEINDHLGQGRGKRFRPTLLLVIAKHGERSSADALFAAACIELIHTASLVHDDFIDQAATRRGLPTVYRKWGDAAALITGDWIYTKVFALMTAQDMVEATKIVARTVQAMSVAEMMQLERRRRLDMTQQDYLTIILKKTASVIEASCEIGALLHPRLVAHRSALADFGRACGMAFQITDDIFDYEADGQQIGKPVGGDWREGRITLPFLAAWNRAPEAERAELQDAVDSADDPQGLWPSVLEFVKRHEGTAVAREHALRYAAEAKTAIDGIDVDPQRAILVNAADYVLARLH